MSEHIKQPWKIDTNGKYSEVVRTLMGLSTASLLLPVFMTREFLGVKSETPLIDILGCSVYWAWGLLCASIILGVAFLYLSAKWVRIAWSKPAGILWSNNTRESTVERFMEFAFWGNVLSFGIGVGLTVFFFATYAKDF